MQLSLPVVNGGTSKFDTQIKLKAKQWYTVICQFDLAVNALLVRVNGKEVEGIKLPNRGIRIGGADDRVWTFASTAGSGSVFHGLVDEFIVYDDAFWPGKTPVDLFGQTEKKTLRN